MATTDYSLAHSLPANVEAERSILGAILLDNFAYNQAAEHLKADDFSLDSHRRIYSRMVDLAETSRPIDLITLVEELDRHKELEAIGDVGYISGLLDGVPDRPSIEHYIRIVRDKALLRGLIHAANAAIARAADQSDPAEEILNDAEAAIFQLSEKRIGRGFMGVQEIVKESFGSVDALLQRGQRVTGLATHYTDLDEMTSGLQKLRPDHHRCAAFHGEDGFCLEHRGERLGRRPESRRRVLAGNVARGTAAAPAVLPGAGGLAQDADRIAVAGTKPKLSTPWSNWPMRQFSLTTRRASR